MVEHLKWDSDFFGLRIGKYCLNTQSEMDELFSKRESISRNHSKWFSEALDIAYPEHIFGYTFACPNVSKRANQSYTNNRCYEKQYNE